MSAKGYKTSVVLVEPNDEPNAVVRALKATGRERLVLLEVTELKTDTMHNAGIFYDMKLSVMGTDGNVLATSEVKGTDDVGADVAHPVKHMKKSTISTVQGHLEGLLNRPDVVKALQ